MRIMRTSPPNFTVCAPVFQVSVVDERERVRVVRRAAAVGGAVLPQQSAGNRDAGGRALAGDAGIGDVAADVQRDAGQVDAVDVWRDAVDLGGRRVVPDFSFVHRPRRQEPCSDEDAVGRLCDVSRAAAGDPFGLVVLAVVAEEPAVHVQLVESFTSTRAANEFSSDVGVRLQLQDVEVGVCRRARQDDRAGGAERV